MKSLSAGLTDTLTMTTKLEIKEGSLQRPRNKHESRRSTQFGVRENTASSRRHALRLATDGHSSLLAPNNKPQHESASPISGRLWHAALQPATTGRNLRGEGDVFLLFMRPPRLFQVPVSWVYERTKKEGGRPTAPLKDSGSISGSKNMHERIHSEAASCLILGARAYDVGRYRRARTDIGRKRYTDDSSPISKRQFSTSRKAQEVWVARWRESVLGADGTLQSIRRSEVIGSLADFPTKRQARACSNPACMNSITRYKNRNRPCCSAISSAHSGSPPFCPH